jgi:hypothetical protein
VWPGREYLQQEHLLAVQRSPGLDPGPLLAALTDLSTPAVPQARARLLHWMYAQARVPELTAQYCPDNGTTTVARPGRVPLRVTAWPQASRQGWLTAQPWQLDWFTGALRHAELAPAPCIREAAAAAIGVDGKVSLADACAHFGVTIDGSGRALARATAAAELAIRCGLELGKLPTPHSQPTTASSQAA